MTRAAVIVAAALAPSVGFALIWIGVPCLSRAVDRWWVHRQLRQITEQPRARKAGRVL